MSTLSDVFTVRHRALRLGLLFGAEALVLIVLFQVSTDLECRATGIEAACRGLRWAGLWLLCAASLMGIWLWARPGARGDFLRMSAAAGGPGWALMHALGLGLVVAPLVLIAPEEMSAAFARVFAWICLGAAMSTLGGLFWLARPGAWAEWLRGQGLLLLAILGFAAALPGIVVLAGPLWTVQVLTDITFIAVFLLLRLVSDAVEVNPETHVIGADGFFVQVAESCSGIEGLVLITAFLGLYAALFRDDLRLRRVWLVIWPLALLASWCFNALRIAALIVIGAHVSPELAVNGFHSFAGWLMFTGLAMAVLTVVSRSRYALQAGAGPFATPEPLRYDEAATRIVPFIVFALSGMLAQALWRDPALGYPLQVAMMAAGLWWARAGVARVLVRPSVPAVLAGLGVGAAWIVTAPEAAPMSEGLAVLSDRAFALWAAMRLLGTIALVPVIEELFFRGYVQARLDRGTVASRVAAVAVSAALFALVHGRWLEAGLAGVVFSVLYMRRGRLADAIAAHSVANATIAGVALWHGDLSLI